jgi:hypothetical protein
MDPTEELPADPPAEVTPPAWVLPDTAEPVAEIPADTPDDPFLGVQVG